MKKLIALFAFLLLFTITPKVNAISNNQIFIESSENQGNTVNCNVDSKNGECYSNLQQAINDANSNATIFMGNGTYKPTDNNPYHSSKSFIINKPLKIVGSGSTILTGADSDNSLGSDSSDVLSNGNTIVLIQSGGVTLNNININGDNTSVSGLVNARNAIVFDYNLNKSYSGVNLLSININNVAFKGIHAKPVITSTDFKIENSSFDNIQNFSGTTALQLENYNKNVEVLNTDFNGISNGIFIYNLSGLEVLDNNFNGFNIGIHYSYLNHNNLATIANNNFTGTGSQTGILVNNFDSNLSIYQNNFQNLNTGVYFVSTSSIDFAGTLYILRNTFTSNSRGIFLDESADVNFSGVFGTPGEGNTFISNTKDIVLSSSFNNTVVAEQNVWTFGSFYSDIEKGIDHNGVLPTGLNLSDSSDISNGNINYKDPRNAIKEIKFNYPHPAVGTHIFNNVVTQATLEVIGEYDPYGIESINFRIGNIYDSSQDSCQELYAFADGSAFDLGDAPQIATNVYSMQYDVSNLPDAEYLVCAFVNPGSGQSKLIFGPKMYVSAPLIVDRSKPLTPGLPNWTTSNPVDLNNISSNANLTTCNTWVNSSYVTNGSLVWEPSIDSNGISYYTIQIYSQDYHTGTLSNSTNSPTNSLNLKLLTNGSDDGAYYFRVKATDISGNSSEWTSTSMNPFDWCKFTVDTISPQASIPSYIVEEGLEELYIVASISDSNGIKLIEWDTDNNGIYDLSSTNNNVLILPSSYFLNGDAQFQIGVRVTDNAGNKTTDSSIINILNVAPVLDFGFNQTLGINDNIVLNAAFSDLGVENLWNYSINFGDGSQLNGTVYSVGIMSLPSHSYSSTGNYTITLTLSDDKATVTKTITATVVNDLPAPVINVDYTYSPNSPKVNQNIVFTPSINNPSNLEIDSYLWNFGDGNSSTAQNPTHSYSTSGTYQVSLTVKLKDGRQFTHSEYVVVNKIPTQTPKPTKPTTTTGNQTNFPANANIIGLDAGSDQSIMLDEEVEVDVLVTGVGYDFSNLTYLFDFGDGSDILESTNAVVTHKYKKAGIYTVTVRLKGYPDSVYDTLSVLVKDPEEVEELENNLPQNINQLTDADIAGLTSDDDKGNNTFLGYTYGELLLCCCLPLLIILLLLLAYAWLRRRKDKENKNNELENSKVADQVGGDV